MISSNRDQKTQQGNRRDHNQDPANETIFGDPEFHSWRER